MDRIYRHLWSVEAGEMRGYTDSPDLVYLKASRSRVDSETILPFIFPSYWRIEPTPLHVRMPAEPGTLVL